MSIRRISFFLLLAVAFLIATGIPTKSNPNPDDELVAGRNVNMVSGITFPDGDPYLQRQNEPSIAVSTRNPLHLLAGANDYRSINIAMEDKLPGPEGEGTNQAPAPDAWLGVFKSIDGGSTWTSTLLPGFYYMDTTPSGTPSSPLYGFSAAADPVVRAGPNGLFFYAGIVFNREDRGDNAVFVSRFIDNNNKENVDTTAYIDTQIQARGTAGQFIDKPWLAVDVPYPEAPSIPIPSPDPETDYQYVTRCNVYLAYSVFLGNPDLNIRTKVYFARSTDSGMTWENPTKLTETQHISQGAVIAVDPRGNGHVWVAWRRFAHINNKGQVIQPDAIVVVKSEDGGATFTKPFVVAELAPWFPPSDNGVFDQPTTHHSFRTNDYPTMAVDHNGTAYIAWTQRGLGPSTDPGVGEARIVMTALMSDGINWSTPTQVISDTEPVYPDPPGPPGHQLMPQLTYAAGKLTLLWYDQRWDVIQDGLPFIEDRYENVRHTIDVRIAQAEILSYPVFSPSIQVSKYAFLLVNDDESGGLFAFQLFYNKPNLPLFSLGTRPFMGDYIGITPSPMFLSPEDPKNPTDHWIYNTDSSVPTIYHAVWTDNRDVVHPTETPMLPGDTPGYGEWDGYNAPGEGCDGTRTAIRNQNIYTSRISEGILAGSPGNTKPLTILRSFVVFIQNMTGAVRAFDLEIIKPTEMEAYFWQEVGEPLPSLEDVVVPPYSYVSKTILVEAYASEYASIIINIYDADSDVLVDYVTLNPDSTNPQLDDPEDMAAGNPHPRNQGETHTPHPRNYTIIDWNSELYDPYINTVVPQYDEAIANNDGVTPYSVEVDPESPHPRNPHGRNPHPRNPHPRNFLLNPHPRNEHIEDIEAGSQMTDVLWTIENAGNTTTSYSINTFETPEDLPERVLAQIIVFKTYTTPAVDIWEGDGCQLVEQEHQEMIVNLTTPHPRNPDPETPHPRNVGELGDVSVTVPPNGVFHVLYRYYNPYQTQEQQEFHDEVKYEEAVPDIVSDTPDTDGDIIVGPPPKLLVIPPQALLDAVVGDTSYSTTLQVVGGTGTYGNWTVIAGALPGGLELDSDAGIIFSDPSPAAVGTYTFKVQVNDLDGESVPQQTATKQMTITVYDSLEISTTSLPGGIVGSSYIETLTATGGNGAYDWSLAAGSDPLPGGLSLSSTGVINGGAPTSTGTFNFTVEVIDTSNPPQTATKELSITINAVVAGSISGEVWFNGQNITNYSIQDATLWARNEGTGQGADPNTTTYNYNSNNGTYTISGLPPGNYGVQVYVNEDTNPPDAGNFPGDFRGWNSPIQVIAGQTTQYNLTCSKIMHLTSPTDNDPPGIQRPTGPPYPSHSSPVIFQWDAVPEATTYTVRVDKYNDPTNYGLVENVFNQSEITDTSITIALSDSAPDQHYELHLYGYNGVIMVGQLMIVYTNGFGWDYRFTVSTNEQILINSTFDSDTVDQPPQTGGTNQPFRLIQVEGPPTNQTLISGTINVRSASNGITTKPVELNDGGREHYFGSVDYEFSGISSGLVVIEATVSFNTVLSSGSLFFLQSYPEGSSTVVTRLRMSAGGNITADGTLVGTCQANIPFRVRKYVDMDSKTYSVVIDDEMDGFDDEVVYSGLQFVNNPNIIPDIGTVCACLGVYNQTGTEIIAYDDIVVKVILP